MSRKTLTAFAGAALILTAGCSNGNVGAAAPAPAAPAPAAASSAEAEESRPEKEAPPKIGDQTSHDSSDEAAYEQAVEDFTVAWEEFTVTYNLGVLFGDNVLEEDPDASLEGFRTQRDALYALDGALREIEWPDEMVEDVNAHLTSIADLISVLDEIDRVEYVEDLEALYDGDLQEARATHQETIQVVLDDLGLELEESSGESADEPAPDAPEEGTGNGGGADFGTGGDVITDAKAVAEELRDAIDLGTAPYVEGSIAFPTEWIPLTHKWAFAGSAITPDPETIAGNTIVYSKSANTSYIGIVIKDVNGMCEALAVEYGPDGDASKLVAGKKVAYGECTHQNGMETLGY